jgi:hypothetical protein
VSQDVSPDVKQARMKEFMSLMPLTTALAGLPDSHADHLFTSDQMEARATTIRMAYKIARQLVRDIGEGL